jgi:hypothetical protein
MAFLTKMLLVSGRCSQYINLLLGVRYPVRYMMAMDVLRLLLVILAERSGLPFLTA